MYGSLGQYGYRIWRWGPRPYSAKDRGEGEVASLSPVAATTSFSVDRGLSASALAESRADPDISFSSQFNYCALLDESSDLLGFPPANAPLPDSSPSPPGPKNGAKKRGRNTLIFYSFTEVGGGRFFCHAPFGLRLLVVRGPLK